MVQHSSCPKCGSKDNLTTWSDGHSFCFTPGCNYKSNGQKKRFNYTSPHTYPLNGIPYRGINATTLKVYGVEYYKQGDTVVVYPYYSSDLERMYSKHRKGGWYIGDTERKVWIDIQNPQITYFGHHVRPSTKTVILCEGESDTLIIAQVFNYKYTVLGVPGADTLLKCHANNDMLTKFEYVVLVLQNDNAAQTILTQLLTIVPDWKIFLCVTSEKDACVTYLQKNSLALEITKAQRLAESPLMSSKNLYAEVTDYLGLTSGRGMGLSTGFPELDKLISGWKPNSITLLAAQTKSGKSTLACQLAHYFALMHGNVLFLSLEMSVAETVLTFCQIAYDVNLLGSETEIDLSQYSKYINWLGTKVHILKHTGFITPDELSTVVKLAVEQHQIKLLIVDHLTIGATSIEDGQSNKNTDVLCMTLKKLVNQYNLSCLAVTQVNEVRSEFITQHDIRGSSVQKQIASSVLGIKRFPDSNQSLVWSLTGDRYTGYTGKMYLNFSKGKFNG